MTSASTPSYRRALPADAEALSAIGAETFVETFGHHYPPDHLRDYLASAYSLPGSQTDLSDPQTEVLFADLDGRPVAYCKIGACKLPIETGSEPCMELHRIYVRAEAQGLGVGRMLLDWTLQRARARGAVNVFLGVWSQNPRALAIYGSRGFEPVGGYKFAVGATLDDEVIMRLRL
jgi:GNAT superfamily N-acetyltransferase